MGWAGGPAAVTRKVMPAVALAPGFTTVMLAEPAVAIKPAATWAVSWVELTNVVGTGTPFHCMAEPVTKPAPVAVSVKPAEPAVVELGLRAARVAAAAGEIVKFSAFETGRAGSATVMGTVPGVRSKLAETCAFNCVGLTKTVGRGAPFH